MDNSDLKLFENLLVNILSSNNQQRIEAEEKYQEIFDNNTDLCLFYLIQIIETSEIQNIRELALILLRQSALKISPIKNEKYFETVSEETKMQIKKHLLENIEKQTIRSTQKKVCDAIAAIGTNELKKGTWTELIPTLCSIYPNASPILQENIIYIFEQLSIYTTESLLPFDDKIIEILTHSIQKTMKIDIRVAGVKAISAYSISLKKDFRRKYQNLIPEMLETLKDCFSIGEFEFGSECIQEFIEISEILPIYFDNYLENVVDTMLIISDSNEIDEKIRQISLECLVILSQKLKRVMKKIPNFLEKIIPIGLRLMTQIEDDPNWQSSITTQTEVTSSDIGESVIDRLSLCFHGDLIVPIAFPLISELLDSGDWKYIYAGLLGITSIGEGSKERILEDLGSVVEKIIPFFKHENARVRFIAITTIAQMSIDFSPYLQDDYHEQIIPAILYVLDDNDFPVIQSRAATTIVNFCTDFSSSVMDLYSRDLLQKLAHLLQSNNISVQEQAITAIGAIASSSSEGFSEFYEELMPYLKNILHQATDKQYEVLRGKTFECISYIGQAVGKEIFEKDGKEIMEMMTKNIEEIELNETQKGFLVYGSIKMCRVLQESFLPYADKVMGILFSQADQKPDQILLDELQNSEDIDVEDCTLIIANDQRFVMRTSVIEEKANAVSLLFQFAGELREHFVVYAEKTLEITVPLLFFYLDKNIRSFSALCVPEVAKDVAIAYEKNTGNVDGEYLSKIIGIVIKKLTKALNKENQDEVISILVQAVSDVISYAKNYVSSDLFDPVISVLPELIQNSYQRRMSIRETLDEYDGEDNEDDDDMANLRKMLETEDEINLMINGVITQLFKFHGGKFFEIFDSRFFPYFHKQLSSEFPFDAQLGVGVFIDVIECGNAETFAHYFPQISSQLLLHVGSPDPGLCQSAAYCVGACAQYGAGVFASYAKDFLSALHAVIHSSHSEDDEMGNAIDNAIGACVKICMFQSNSIDQSSAFQALLNDLPVLNDTDESKTIYSLVCQFIEQENPYFVGSEHQNIPRIVEIISQVYNTELVDDEVNTRMFEIIIKIKNHFPNIEIDENLFFGDL
ncbi:arm repeat superfamily protein [Anaeramoeba ignava]|uniref:Arm repeat superfamily protein n=1 Tax=Anaeramoeba ignava TaxID=1746090 RepID=A0A9Q0LNX3_ANAIG|nr:arm repeat superfamily protein [Anaeramoeba ignava]